MAENDRPLVIYRLKERGWGPQTERYKNNEYTYHIFDSSTMSSNRRLTRPTSVIVLQSRIIFMGSISKQATKQLGPDLFFLRFLQSKNHFFCKISSWHNFSAWICHPPWPHVSSLFCRRLGPNAIKFWLTLHASYHACRFWGDVFSYKKV